MEESIRHIVCPHCNSVNRVAIDKPADRARCGHCHKALFTRTPISVSSKSFATHATRNGILVVVDFWPNWCGPCKAVAPAYAHVAADLEPDGRFLKVDTEAAPDLAATYNIRSIPTLMIFKRGIEKARMIGAMDAGSLRSWVLQHV